MSRRQGTVLCLLLSRENFTVWDLQKEGLCCRISFVDAEASVGGVAQLGEHHVRNVGVKGSNPSISIFSLGEIAWI